jgi:hypothetical protein
MINSPSPLLNISNKIVVSHVGFYFSLYFPQIWFCQIMILVAKVIHFSVKHFLRAKLWRLGAAS